MPSRLRLVEQRLRVGVRHRPLVPVVGLGDVVDEPAREERRQRQLGVHDELDAVLACACCSSATSRSTTSARVWSRWIGPSCAAATVSMRVTVRHDTGHETRAADDARRGRARRARSAHRATAPARPCRRRPGAPARGGAAAAATRQRRAEQVGVHVVAPGQHQAEPAAPDRGRPVAVRLPQRVRTAGGDHQQASRCGRRSARPGRRRGRRPARRRRRPAAPGDRRPSAALDTSTSAGSMRSWTTTHSSARAASAGSGDRRPATTTSSCERARADPCEAQVRQRGAAAAAGRAGDQRRARRRRPRATTGCSRPKPMPIGTRQLPVVTTSATARSARPTSVGSVLDRAARSRRARRRRCASDVARPAARPSRRAADHGSTGDRRRHVGRRDAEHRRVVAIVQMRHQPNGAARRHRRGHRRGTVGADEQQDVTPAATILSSSSTLGRALDGVELVAQRAAARRSPDASGASASSATRCSRRHSRSRSCRRTTPAQRG